jgi:ATP-dependent DNA helicase DinG
MDRFQRTENCVLFGTSSFWEGVDIKGEALSCVIIDKLPFAAPGDPVLKSRLQACEEGGGNPFMEIQVPGAAIALKQGSGRLIRSETDRGVLVICDPRITTKRYGKKFLDALPPMPVSRQIHDVNQFFKA